MMTTYVDMDELRQRRICSACIGEKFLKKAVDSEGTAATCSYCGGQGPTITIEDLADHAEGAIDRHYVPSSTEPSSLEAVMIKEGYGWERSGSPVIDVIAELAVIEPQPAEDARLCLDDRHADVERDKAGEEGPYDKDTHYVASHPDDADLHLGWSYFERSLKRESRFFSAYAIATLDEIFSGIEHLKTSARRRVIRSAGPGTKLVALHRARVFQSDSKLEQALKDPPKEIGSPPWFAAAAGRMNARGVSVFYGATTSAAAIAEVRPPVGSRVAVGRFEFLRPVRLLDVKALRSIYVSGSVFDPGYARRLAHARFLETLSHRITMPVMPDDETFDYLVTQAIADYLAAHDKLSLDGIAYQSTQDKGVGFNVVLFHKSAKVEPLELPKGTEVTASLYHVSEEGSEEDYWVFEEVPPPVSTPPRDSEWPSMMDFIVRETRSLDDEDSRQPTLRLDPSTLNVHRITGVKFSSNVNQVRRHRHPKTRPDF